MVPNYVLRVKINDKVIYEKKDLCNRVCIQNNINSYNNKKKYICETLPMEVLKNARRS